MHFCYGQWYGCQSAAKVLQFTHTPRPLDNILQTQLQFVNCLKKYLVNIQQLSSQHLFEMAVIPRLQNSAFTILRRNMGFSAVLAQKGQATDPIQKLFVQKIKEYDQKSKASPGKLVDSTPQIEKDLKQELDRVAKIYGGGSGVDMTKFPTVNFQEPTLDPINQQAK